MLSVDNIGVLNGGFPSSFGACRWPVHSVENHAGVTARSICAGRLIRVVGSLESDRRIVLRSRHRKVGGIRGAPTFGNSMESQVGEVKLHIFGGDLDRPASLHGPRSPSEVAKASKGTSSPHEARKATSSDAEIEDEPLLVSEDASRLQEMSGTEKPSSTKAELLLFLVPVLWGTYGPAIKYIYESPGPPSVSILTTLRAALSVIAFFAILPFESARSRPPPSEGHSDPERSGGPWSAWNFPPGTWLAGVELGIWNTVGTALQMLGLQETSATQAGFLIQSVNVLVPALLVASGQPVRKSIWVAVPLCIAGVLLLSQKEGGGVEEASVVGDALLLASAFCYAMFTVRLGVHARHLPAVALTAAKMVVGVGLGLLWVGWDWGVSLATGGMPQPTWQDWDNPLVWGLILYSSLFPGALASVIMAVGQKSVPAAEAQIVYSTTPLFSALLAFFLLHEVLSFKGWVGGALLVASTAAASYEGRDHANIETGQGEVITTDDIDVE